ncbi:MAG: phosphoglycerate mutase, partial [Actinobacteria bacterium]|nr:phosphoglycerate mutase [Actinomycetota bacterium]
KVIKIIKEALHKEVFDYKIMILPDHPTPVSLRTHTDEPVPFLIYTSNNIKYNPSQKYYESAAEKTGLYFDRGCKLTDYFFSKK